MTVWHVTLLDRGHEITVEVYGTSSTAARRAAKELHPGSHIIHCERQGFALYHPPA